LSSYNVSDNADWLTVSQSGNTITASYSENTSTSSRVAAITVSGSGVSDQTVTVTQAAPTGPSPPIQTIPNEINFMEGATASLVFDNMDQINPASIKYKYKMLSSSGNYQETAPTQDGNNFTVELIESMFDGLGISSYFEYATSDETTISTNIEHTYIIYGGDGLPITMPSGFGDQVKNYQIIAIPYDLDNKSVSSIFFDDLTEMDNTKWRLWHYQESYRKNVELSSSNTIERGLGYWLIVKDATKIDTGGGTTRLSNDQPNSISLTTGYNQIGNPYNFGISWQDVLNYNGICYDLTIVGYRNGIVNTLTNLNAFEGGFVEVTNGPMELVIPFQKNIPSNCRVAEGPATKNPINEEHWLVNLNLYSGELGNKLAGFGMHPEAKIEKDYFDKSAFPRFVYYVEAIFKHPQANITRDIVPTSESYIWEFDVNTNMDSEFTVLEWDNTNFGNNEKEIYLYDQSRQRIVDMREQSSYQFSTVPTSSFQIHYGYREDIEENLLPARISLGPGYPNPATSQITIPFTLPENEGLYNVSLVVYDLIGNEIRELLNNRLGGGFHEIVWDLDNDKGNTTSSGVYVIQLKAVVNGQQSHFNSKIIIR